MTPGTVLRKPDGSLKIVVVEVDQEEASVTFNHELRGEMLDTYHWPIQFFENWVTTRDLELDPLGTAVEQSIIQAWTPSHP